MAKPTPFKTALKSLQTTVGCLNKVYIATGAQGKFARVGSDTRYDLEAVNAELAELAEAAELITKAVAQLQSGLADSIKPNQANNVVKPTFSAIASPANGEVEAPF